MSLIITSICVSRQPISSITYDKSFYTRPLHKKTTLHFTIISPCIRILNNAELQKIQLWYSRLSLISGWPSSLCTSEDSHWPSIATDPKRRGSPPLIITDWNAIHYTHTDQTRSNFTQENCYPYSLCNDLTLFVILCNLLLKWLTETKGQTDDSVIKTVAKFVSALNK